MLWAFLISLLIAKLSGGPEEIFMIPNLDKEIKSHIVDKERKSEILLVVKEAKKEIKAFEKLRKNKLKEIEKLGKSKEVPSGELLAIHKVYNDARLNMQSVLIDKRLKIQELIKDEEWEQLIENAVLPSEKSLKKIEKGESKEDDKVEKLLTNIEETIIKEIKEAERRQNLLTSLERFNTSIKEFVEETQKMNFKDNSIVRKKDTSRKELEDFYTAQNELRHKGTVEYFQLRDTVIQHTNDDEWKAIYKAINSIVKS